MVKLDITLKNGEKFKCEVNVGSDYELWNMIWWCGKNCITGNAMAARVSEIAKYEIVR